MGRMDSPHHGHDGLAATPPGGANLGPHLSQADPALSEWYGDPGEGSLSPWENAWIDLGGEG